MFSAPELLVHSPSFPVRGGNNKHAEMWHLGTATRFLLGIYKLENNRSIVPYAFSSKSPGPWTRAPDLRVIPWGHQRGSLHSGPMSNVGSGAFRAPELRAESRETHTPPSSEARATSVKSNLTDPFQCSQLSL